MNSGQANALGMVLLNQGFLKLVNKIQNFFVDVGNRFGLVAQDGVGDGEDGEHGLAQDGFGGVGLRLGNETWVKSLGS